MPFVPTILVADADPALRELLAAQLDLDGYTVHEVPTVSGTMSAFAWTSPTVVVLGAFERPSAAASLLRDLRAGRIDKADASVPVVTLGDMDALSQLRAYEDGSDHHLARTVPYVMLRVILAAIVRRARGPQERPRIIELGSLKVDLASREVRTGTETITLPAREFELLSMLAVDPTRVYTKQELLKQIWGYDDPRSTRTLDSHACRLRRRLADHGQPGLVRAVWGVGYRLTS